MKLTGITDQFLVIFSINDCRWIHTWILLFVFNILFFILFSFIVGAHSFVHFVVNVHQNSGEARKEMDGIIAKRLRFKWCVRRIDSMVLQMCRTTIELIYYALHPFHMSKSMHSSRCVVKFIPKCFHSVLVGCENTEHIQDVNPCKTQLKLRALTSYGTSHEKEMRHRMNKTSWQTCPSVASHALNVLKLIGLLSPPVNAPFGNGGTEIDRERETNIN